MLVQRLTKQQIESKFPELAAALTAEDAWGLLPGAQWPKGSGHTHVAPGIGKGLHEVWRLMVRPCQDFPKGREIVMVTGNEIAKADYAELRTHDKTYPLEMLNDIPMGPFMEERGRMTITRSMQNMLDELISKKATVVLEAPNLTMGIPPSMNKDEVTNKGVLLYHKMGPGGDITMQEVPATRNLDSLIQDTRGIMDDVHSQGPSSRGQVQGERQSGRAIDSAIAADEQGDSPLLSMLRRAMGRTGKRILAEGQRVWKPEYIFQVLGKNNRYEQKAFESANLQKGFDVRVLPDQGLPRGRAARLKLMTDAMKNGLLSDTPEARRARALVHITVDDDTIDFQASERALIKQEEEMFDDGREVPINWCDDDALHLEVHKSTCVQRLAHGAVEGKEDKFVLAIDYRMNHGNAHSKRISEGMQAQIGMSAAAEGKPDSAPAQG